MLRLEERARNNRIEQDEGSLSLSIRNLLLNEITCDIQKEQPLIKQLSQQIRRDLNFFQMTKHERYERVAGVDAGSQILPLASRRYGILSALVYVLPKGKKYWLTPESISLPYKQAIDRFKGFLNIRREIKLYETAIQFLENESEIELLLVDGPLSISDWWKVSGSKKDHKNLINSLNKLLTLCKEKSVLIAGIVKRPSACYLINKLGLDNVTELHDSVLLLHSLHVGERTDIFSHRSPFHGINQHSIIIDVIEYPIYSFYGKMSNDWSIPPIRIDVPSYSLGHLDDIADYCYTTSVWNGIPLAIVKADEAVRITRRFMLEVYQEIFSRVNISNGELRGLAPYWGEGRWMGV